MVRLSLRAFNVCGRRRFPSLPPVLFLPLCITALSVFAACGSGSSPKQRDESGERSGQGQPGDGSAFNVGDSGTAPNAPYPTYPPYGPQAPFPGSTGGQEVTGSGGTQYSYQYSEGSCTTGMQTSRSLQEHCWRLSNDAINQGCARFARQNRAAMECR